MDDPAMRPLIAALLLSALAGPAWAHAAAAGVGWTWDPWISLPLAVALGLFAAGWRRLHGRTGRGAERLRRRGLLFVLGWTVLAGALVSPLHEAGERSFTAHMLEHELLMLAAAPLLVLAEPLAVLLWAFPAAGRRRVGRLVQGAQIPALSRRLTAPVFATLAQAAALWLWHAPTLFDRALQSDGWHVAQHLSFLLTALLFWSAMLTRRPRNPGLAALCLFATSVVSGALGAMMAFAQSPWYAPYSALGMAPLGLTPLEDQQLAGLLMWAPGGAVHVAAALAVIATTLRAAPGLTSEARHGA
jgi:cytochrome c oxidase assembly factor CtaG